MKFLKTSLMALGGVALLLLLVPKTAHAVVATLVQVVNTTSNPVPNLDTERIARRPYQSNSTQTCTTNPCEFGFTPVPVGYRLVTQNFAGNFSLLSGSTSLYAYMTDSFSLAMGLPGAVGPLTAGAVPAGFNQQLTTYFEAGRFPLVLVYGNFNSGTQSVALTGYLENCSVTGCPAIQN
jgi:hypothetical protein